MVTDELERLRAALAPEYQVDRELGRGGMATVYLALELKHDRQVAIKVMRPEIARMLGPDRFLREIRIAARLSHPHIVPLLASGQAGDVRYYVMPYIALVRQMELT
jgi:eukaryotic-like serine/threonine-protein kinase